MCLCSWFQGIVGEKVCQFRGFMQQDAQEFMAFLLDGLHEVGLNLIGNYHAILHVRYMYIVASIWHWMELLHADETEIFRLL